jgi:hypothetical protein
MGDHLWRGVRHTRSSNRDDQRVTLSGAPDNDACRLPGSPLGGDLLEIVGVADRNPRQLFDQVACLHARSFGWRSASDGSNVRSWPFLGIRHHEPQGGARMPRGHPLQAREIKSHDRLLLVGDDWDGHLAGAPKHFIGCLPVDGHIAFMERDSALD